MKKRRDRDGENTGDLTTNRGKNDRDGGGTGYLQHEFTDVLLRAVKWQLMKEKERET